MAFNGMWELESQVGFDEFYKLIGIPDDVIEMAHDIKSTTEVVQNGNDFTWSRKYPNTTQTNRFTIGQECDMKNFLMNNTFKATVVMDGGKVVIQYPRYLQTSEIIGGKLVETSTIGTVVLTRTSSKL